MIYENISASYDVGVAKKFGLNCAVLLNKLNYLCKYTSREDGFCWRSATELENELGLSRKQLELAVKKLEDAQIIETKNTYIIGTQTKCKHYKVLVKSDLDERCKSDFYERCKSVNNNQTLINNNTINMNINSIERDTFSIHNNFKSGLKCEELTKSGSECLRRSSFNINGKNYCNQHARELIPDLKIETNRFKKPTMDEVEAYCKERNNNVDAKKFYEYYEVNNWKDRDGKQVKNWKQKVITWEGRGVRQVTKIEATPDWFDKDLQINQASIDERKEMEDILNNY